MKFLTATDRYIARLVAIPLISTLALAAMLLLALLRLLAAGCSIAAGWSLMQLVDIY